MICRQRGRGMWDIVCWRGFQHACCGRNGKGANTEACFKGQLKVHGVVLRTGARCVHVNLPE
jgi:hypothetical protein